MSSSLNQQHSEVPLIPKNSPFYTLACIDFQHQSTIQSARDVLYAVVKTLKEESTKSKTELTCDAIQAAADITKIGIEIAGYAADTTKNTVVYATSTTKHVLIDRPINMAWSIARTATAPVGFMWRVAANRFPYKMQEQHKLTAEKAHKRTKRKNEQKRRKHRRLHEQQHKEEKGEQFESGKAAKTPETISQDLKKEKTPEAMISHDLEKKGERYQPQPLESYAEKMEQPSQRQNVRVM